MKSVSTKLLILTLSAAIIGMGLIAGIATFVSGTALQRQSLGKINQNTAREAAKINGWLETQAGYAAAFAADTAFQPDFERERMLPIQRAHVAQNPQLFDVYVGFPTGQVIFSSGNEPDYAGGWAAYKRPWYVGAVKNTAAPFITSPYTDTQTGKLCITAAKAVVSSGELKAVVGLDIFIDTLQQIVSGTNVAKDSYAFMLDANGDILIHPEKDYAPSENGSFSNIATIENGLYKPMWEHTSAGDISYAFKSKDGVTRYYTAQKIDATGWVLYSTVPADVVNEPIRQLLIYVVPTFLIVLMLAALLIYFSIRRTVVRPIHSITAAAKELAVGNADIHLEGRYEGEMLLLRDSFNNMAELTRKQVEATTMLADGNLNVEIPVRSERDVMGQALQRLSDSLREMITGIKRSSERVSGGANQIATHAHGLAQGSTEQAAAVEQLSASITHITEQIRTSQEKAANASRLSEEMGENARGGMERMEKMVAAVSAINDASASISKIIKTIDDIAFQTNILALNASVEAARAGQHGQGFGVVAEEVRNLAVKSAAAAQESSNLIQNSIAKASEGVKIARDTSAALGTVITGIRQSTELIGDISAYAEEEYTAITEINKGIVQVNQVVSSNAATAQESAAAASELSEESSLLLREVGSFRLADSAPVLGAGARRQIGAPRGAEEKY